MEAERQEFEMNPWKLTWNDGMSVGIQDVDEDHRQFIHLVNQFNSAVADRMSSEEVKKRLQDILDDAVKHFDHEEKLFCEWGYPDAADHACIHAQIIQTLQDIKKNCITYGFDAEWIDAGLQIKDALISHILNEDMKYADYCRLQRLLNPQENLPLI